MVLENGLTYAMPLEVYLQTAVVRGVLVTNQDRLSNFLILREGDEAFALKDAMLENSQCKTIVAGPDEFLIYMQEVCAIADLSPQTRDNHSALESVYVKKDASRALLSVGPYWLQGNLYIAPGGTLHDLLFARSRFLPLTDPISLQRPDVGPHTYLVNRMKIGFMTNAGSDLPQ